MSQRLSGERMQAVGLITEYNPFHNGHLHHLHESLRVCSADVSVAVMSGHFLQRGEPALVDKWARAEMALAAGVDIVVELPLPWAASSAPDFARGAVQALSALGVDSLCFGSESGMLSPLQQCADFFYEHETSLANEAATLLRQGVNYPQARGELLAKLLPAEIDPAMVVKPNNILGIEYLKAIRQLDSTIQPATIQRIGAGYHDETVGADGIASATGIRGRLAVDEPVCGLLPETVKSILDDLIATGATAVEENYFRLLMAQIFGSSDSLDSCWLVENGIDNRLIKVAETAESLEQLLVGIKSKQLTRTRIQRLLVSLLLRFDKQVIPQLFSAGPQYLHLLATSGKGREFLSDRRKQISLPLIQNFSRIYATLKRHYGVEPKAKQLALQQLDLELRATKIYTLLQRKAASENRNRDFFQPVIMID